MDQQGDEEEEEGGGGGRAPTLINLSLALFQERLVEGLLPCDLPLLPPARGSECEEGGGGGGAGGARAGGGDQAQKHGKGSDRAISRETTRTSPASQSEHLIFVLRIECSPKA